MIDFYSSICGMDYVCQAASSADYPYCQDGKLHLFSYKEKDPSYTRTSVCFVVDDNFTAAGYDDPGYWKIGIVLQDVRAAVRCFRERGSRVGSPGQFVDVGFLTSLRDPQGYSIELLQDSFEENFREVGGERAAPLNQPYMPAIGQITIRSREADKTCHFYTAVLGMKLLCTEVPGNRYPFTLYFFAYTAEEPPNSQDLSAVENREWTYQRPYCQIEVQHCHNLPSNFSYQTHDQVGSDIRLGHVGISLQVSRERIREIVAKDQGARYLNVDQSVAHISDPDGYLIELSCEQ